MTVYDLVYGLGIAATAPVWLAAPKLRRKVVDALLARRGEIPSRQGAEPAALIHAVSMGEINATTALVRRLADADPALRFIVSTTSMTGAARARELYGKDPRVTLIRYPFDFSRSVARLLDAQRPAIAVLMELEVWPNFTRECARRGIPIVLVNGRLSAHSFRGYRWAGPAARAMFGRLAIACVQEQAYAERFIRVGVSPERVRVTGTMKFDTAQIADQIAGAEEVARSVGLRAGDEKIWVCGSTGPGEEQIVLDAYPTLLSRIPTLRLVIVPRHPERFDEVADLIRSAGFPLVRRSAARNAIACNFDDPTSPPPQGAVTNVAAAEGLRPVILGDTMGELRKFYSLADVVFVGRTLVDLGPKQHGSDMIEPAALAKPVVVGPFTGNFTEVMNRFTAADAIRVVGGWGELIQAVEHLFTDGQRIGSRAQAVVRENQGATARHAEVILKYLHHRPNPDASIDRSSS